MSMTSKLDRRWHKAQWPVKSLAHLAW